MILLVNGCSMTYGSELDENPTFSTKKNYEHRLNKGWAGQLNKMLHFEDFYNISNGGSSNSRIVRTTLDWTSKYLIDGNDSSNLFVIIGWTAPSRYEIKTKERGWADIHPTYLPPKNDIELYKITEFYSKYLTNKSADELKSLIDVLLLQSWLKLNHIPYLFFNALPFVCKHNLEAQNYSKQIDRKRYYNFNNKQSDMHIKISIQNLPFGPKMHPLEDGHLFWANTLYEYIIKEKLLREN